jgi:hypothetical protein
MAQHPTARNMNELERSNKISSPTDWDNYSFISSATSPPAKESRIDSLKHKARKARMDSKSTRHVEKTVSPLEKERMSDSRAKSMLGADTMMHDAGAFAATTWAVSGFSFAAYEPFAPEQQDKAFSSLLLQPITSNIRIVKPQSRSVSKKPPPSLDELGFVIQEGNIIHRTYQKARIIRVQRRRFARNSPEQRRVDTAYAQVQEQQIQKYIKAEFAPVMREETKKEFDRLVK